AARHAHGHDAGPRRARDRQLLARARADRDLPALRRGAVREADRARDRAPQEGAAVRAHGRARRHDQVRDPGSRPVRRGASGEASLPGAADRRERRAGLARGRASGCPRHAAAGGPPGRHRLPFARGPDRQAVPAREGARLHVPARLPGLRVRARAGAPCARAAPDQAVAGGDRRQPARLLGPPAGRGEDQGGRLMAALDWFAEDVAPPVMRPVAGRRPRQRPQSGVRPRRRGHGVRLTGGILWISAFAVLLAGVVAVNVAVLRVHMNVTNLNRQQLDLQAQNATLASQLSSAGSSLRIEQAARRLGFVPLLVRAAWITTVRASALSQLGQVQTKAPVVLPAGRGTIFDSMGAPLALGEQATTVYADPHEVRSPMATARTVARILRVKPNDVFRALTAKGTHFAYVARKADPAAAARLAKLSLPGLHFYAEERRTYPQKTVAAPILGFAGVDNNGLSGLELELDKQLTGKPGEQTVVRDPLGRAISVAHTVPARPGRSVFLTIDHTIQANAEQVLRDTLRRWHAHHATAIVLDPKTGAVLAMAEAPSYDANASSSRGLQTNHAVTDVFEPGSVFKVVTIAGALSEHLVTPRTTFTLPYSIQVADCRIHDAELRGTERMPVAQILQRSSNVGTVTIARDYLGETRLKKWIRHFGFGARTGIDFPAESGGLLPSYWSGSTIGNVPIGQGISV